MRLIRLHTEEKLTKEFLLASRIVRLHLALAILKIFKFSSDGCLFCFERSLFFSWIAILHSSDHHTVWFRANCLLRTGIDISADLSKSRLMTSCNWLMSAVFSGKSRFVWEEKVAQSAFLIFHVGYLWESDIRWHSIFMSYGKWSLPQRDSKVDHRVRWPKLWLQSETSIAEKLPE